MQKFSRKRSLFHAGQRSTISLSQDNCEEPANASIDKNARNSLAAPIANEVYEPFAAEERFRSMTSASDIMIWAAGIDKLCTWFNPAWLSFAGRSLADQLAVGWAEDIHPEDKRRCLATYSDKFELMYPFTVEYRRRRHDGQYLWVLDTCVPRFDHLGDFAGYCGSCIDMAELKRAESRLEIVADIFRHACEGIMITDGMGAIVEINDAFVDITGYSREDAIGHTPRILKSDRHEPEFYSALWRELAGTGHWHGEILNRRKNGDIYAARLYISALRNTEGKIKNYISLLTDVTPANPQEKLVEYLAHHDALTNLPNRILLLERLQQAMSDSLRLDQALAVAYLDLDNFKSANDRYGHKIGDRILIALSQRMKTLLRDGDILARIGGDEFVVVLVGLERAKDWKPAIERLISAAFEPLSIGKTTLRIAASIGVALYPQDKVHADQLLRHADQAMYTAKQAGKNRCHVFDIAQSAAMTYRRENLECLNQALERGEFVLHYQPKVNMKTGVTIGAEALIRWQHPQRGLLPPSTFLPLIENDILGVELGKWALDAALAQLAEWHGQELKNLTVSVNIGARQLQQEDFVDYLRERLDRFPDLPAEAIELEIVESSALEDIDHVSRVIRACRELGVRFALDDFGTGYSSLTYLKRLPADIIKIDQSFVRDIIDDADDRAIVQGVIGLASSFRRTVVAEGVETIKHGEVLLLFGCELAQGYGIARPMPGKDLPCWIKQWQAPEPWTKLPSAKNGLACHWQSIDTHDWI